MSVKALIEQQKAAKMVDADDGPSEVQKIVALLRIIIMLIVGVAIIVGCYFYVQGGLDKNQKKMDDAVEFMQRGK